MEKLKTVSLTINPFLKKAEAKPILFKRLKILLIIVEIMPAKGRENDCSFFASFREHFFKNLKKKSYLTPQDLQHFTVDQTVACTDGRFIDAEF